MNFISHHKEITSVEDLISRFAREKQIYEKLIAPRDCKADNLNIVDEYSND